MKFFLFSIILLGILNVAKAQNIGVGQATPLAKLHITQTTSASIPGIIIDQPGTTGTFGSGATGSIGLLINTTASSNARGIQVLQNGTGMGQAIHMLNASTTEQGFNVNHLGLGIGTYLYNSNANNFSATLFAQHDGKANVAYFYNKNTANFAATVYAQQDGSANVGYFYTKNATTNAATIYAQQDGLGNAGNFFSKNTASNAATVYAQQDGINSAGYFYSKNAINTTPTVYGYQDGLGSVGYFYSKNAANANPTVYGFQEGTGSAGYFYNKSTTANNPTVYGFQEGISNAGYFYNKNTANTAATIYSFQEGNGNAGYFYSKNTTNTSPAIYSIQEGLSNAAYFYTKNSSNTAASIYSINYGLGNAITAYNINTTNTNPTLYTINDGKGKALTAYTTNATTTDFTAGIFNNGTSTAGTASGGLYVAHLNTTTVAHNAFFNQLGTGRSLEIFRPNKLASVNDPALIISDSSLANTAVFQSQNTANLLPTALILNKGISSNANGILSGTFSSSGAQGIAGTAYITPVAGVPSITNITETGPVGVQGVAGATTAAQLTKGVAGYAVQHNTTDASGSSDINPGYFALLKDDLTTITSSAVAVRTGGTNYKILGISGTPVVSTSREDHTGKRVILYAPESPMPTYTDYGSGKLSNGTTHINIDPAFANMIYVNPTDNAPLRILVQLEGDCNGVFVTNKTATGFDVVELNHGSSNVAFTYQIIANSKDYTDPISGEKNSLQNIRFPELDKKLYPSTYKKSVQTGTTVISSNVKNVQLPTTAMEEVKTFATKN
jgi:hypothetical protein